MPPSMACTRAWLVLFLIIGACTCGSRSECGKRAQISLLTSVHDDPSCRKLSSKGVLMSEAAKLLTEMHNNKSGPYEIELTVLDTCGSIAGALKAAMKALVYADINCLHPPYYLGIIGPDAMTNAEAVHKVTSVLKVPHVVKGASQASYLHHLAKESNSYLVEATLKVIEALKWKSFTIAVRADEDNDDDVQNVAKKLTMSAIAKDLCVLVHDNDEEDYTTHVVHIGKPDAAFFNGPVNATIVIVSEGNLEKHLVNVKTNNTVLLLEDSRNELPGLEARVENSAWWGPTRGVGKYDAEELREVRWLEDAIDVYSVTLNTLCKKKKCKGAINPIDWNSVLKNVLQNHNSKSEMEPRSLTLSLKTRSAELETLASIKVKHNKAKIYWHGQTADDDDGDDEDDDNKHGENNDNDDDDDDDDVPTAFKKLLSAGKHEVRSGCASTMKEIKMLHEDDSEAAQVLVHEMDDSEWWTMVGTVSGVGVAMFAVGILAVYVVYTNVRGPRTPKNKRSLERDTSLRRIGSDREQQPATGSGRNQRPNRAAQRRDSNRSIRSNMSDKSV